VDLYDWLLALHLLAAASLVAALTLFTVMILSSRRASVPSEVASFWGLGRFGTVIVAVGTLGTLVFGIWLAVEVDEYRVWDGWIIAAIVLWAVASEAGRRSGIPFTKAGKRARELLAAGNDAPDAELGTLMGDSRAFLFHWITVAATLAILVLMIYKPGA
jgi:heme A synthase